jgi:gliding motility-associated-like protein
MTFASLVSKPKPFIYPFTNKTAPPIRKIEKITVLSYLCYMRRSYLLLFLFVAVFSWASDAPKFVFQQNKNQWPQKVNFAADLGAGQVFIEKTGLTYVVYNSSDLEKQHAKKFEKEDLSKNDILHAHVYKVEFVNAKLTDQKASKQQPEYYNYFLGNDPSHWASNVKAFEKIYYSNIYKNIDAKFYGNNGQFKYDLIVKPGGKISDIKLDYQFTKSVSLVNNKLLVQTSVGEIIEHIPEAYQIIKGKKVKVNCHFVLSEKNYVAFETFGEYDPNYDLIIDPVVVVSSYSGTQSITFGLGVVPDEKGNMFLYGMNITRGYPTTAGAIQMTSGGGQFDSVLSKFNFLGTSKRFSTYIGGNKEDKIINCFVQNGEVAIFGSTRSDSFPILDSGFQKIFGGNIDYFLIKLDTSGKNLIGSTYLGGNKAEAGSSIGLSSAYFNVNDNRGEMIMDQWNNCYVIGSTYSWNFPTSPGAYRELSDSNGASDISITKLNHDLSAIIWSTYYGGSFANYPVGLRISKSGKLFCGGGTNSRNFPTTPGVVHTTSVSTQDMVTFILDTLSGYPIASTYIGAPYTEALRFDIDRNENVYMAGACLATPITISVTPGTYNLNTGRIVFYKIDPGLSTVNAVARFGYNNTNNTPIEIDAMNVDSCGYVYFGGFGHPGLPVTADALKPACDPKGNLYLGVFNPGFTSLKTGTYYGSDNPKYMDHDDGGLSYFDDRGYFYHAICVERYFPTTPGCYSTWNVQDSVGGPTNYYAESDAFVKIDLQTFVNANLSLGGQTKSCAPINQTFFASPNYGTVTIDPGDGSGAVNTNSLVHLYNTYGTYTAMVIAGTDPASCNQIDSVQIIIKYGPTSTANLEDITQNCGGEELILDAGNPGAKFVWNTGDSTQIIHPGNGKYWVTVDNGFCVIKDSTVVVVNPGHDLSMPNAFTPNGDNTNEQFCLQGWDFCLLQFHIDIFSRWGERVFGSDDPNFCWDGKYKGQLLSSDVYIYNITANFKGDKLEKRKGNITLIR